MTREEANARKWYIKPAHDNAIYALLEDFQSVIQGTFEFDESDEYWDSTTALCMKFANKYHNNYFARQLVKSYLNYQRKRYEHYERSKA